MSNENHHALAAGSILSAANASELGWETADAQHIAAHIEAQTEATLALAYEQRTANLIAFERTQWDAWRRDELKPEGVQLWTKAANQIAERLDLA